MIGHSNVVHSVSSMVVSLKQPLEFMGKEVDSPGAYILSPRRVPLLKLICSQSLIGQLVGRSTHRQYHTAY